MVASKEGARARVKIGSGTIGVNHYEQSAYAKGTILSKLTFSQVRLEDGCHSVWVKFGRRTFDNIKVRSYKTSQSQGAAPRRQHTYQCRTRFVSGKYGLIARISYKPDQRRRESISIYLFT
jgi:hypothetical protein